MKNHLDTLLNPKVMDLSIPYYDDLSRISNSSLGWFMISPQYFKKMMDGEGVKLDKSFLRKGSRIHKYLLEPETFWKEYRISTAVQPSSKNQIQFADEYCKAMDTNLSHSEACLSAFKASYSITGKAEDKMATEGLKIAESLQEYIEELRSDDNREKMSFADNAELKDIAKNVQNNKLANDLVYPDKSKLEVYSEFHINWVHSESNIECKSLLDRLIIDNNNKKITLVDLKTTNKIYNFEESMIEYGYYRQMAFYWKALEWYFVNVRKEDFSECTKETYIVGISTNEFTKNEVRVFPIDTNKLIAYEILIQSLFSEIKYHMDNNTNFEHTVSYYLNDGKESITNEWKIAS